MVINRLKNNKKNKDLMFIERIEEYIDKIQGNKAADTREIFNLVNHITTDPKAMKSRHTILPLRLKAFL